MESKIWQENVVFYRYVLVLQENDKCVFCGICYNSTIQNMLLSGSVFDVVVVYDVIFALVPVMDLTKHRG